MLGVASRLLPSSTLRRSGVEVLNQTRTIANIPHFERHIRFDPAEGRKRPSQDVLDRFKRLNNGMWVRAHPGKNKLRYIKDDKFQKTSMYYETCTKEECWMLDKMMTPYWLRPKHYHDDPYKAYHVRHGIDAPRVDDRGRLLRERGKVLVTDILTYLSISVVIRNKMTIIYYVEECLNNPHQTSYADLLAREDVKTLEATHNDVWKTLNVFAFGTYSDLVREVQSAIPDPILVKIRQLTLITLAGQSSTLKYADLLSELALPSVRSLEDLVIDAVYKGLIRAKLDSKAQLVKVQDWQARDVRPEQLAELKQAICACVSTVEGVSNQLNNNAIGEEQRCAEETEQRKEKEKKLETARTEVEEIVTRMGNTATSRTHSSQPQLKEKRKMVRKANK